MKSDYSTDEDQCISEQISQKDRVKLAILACQTGSNQRKEH